MEGGSPGVEVIKELQVAEATWYRWLNQRPWVHDLVRLSHQQFVGRPELAAAFYDGLGKVVGPA